MMLIGSNVVRQWRYGRLVRGDVGTSRSLLEKVGKHEDQENVDAEHSKMWGQSTRRRIPS